MGDVVTNISQPAAQVLEYLAGCAIPPTHREIQQACGISSTSVVAYYLEQLEEAGLIRRPAGKGSSRNIVVVR
jgi:SOS-response transcriptional repressor LexA